MSRQKNLVAHLLDAFPPRRFHGNATQRACDECAAIRATLDDASWWAIPADFIRQHAAHLPLLTQDAYIAFLPAWMRAAVEEPGGEVASVVIAELGKPEVAAYFSRQQAYAVMQIAKWLAEHPAHQNALERIEQVWNG